MKNPLDMTQEEWREWHANHTGKPCMCGSGLARYELVDAAGTFCTYVCERCEAGARANYNPAIFESGSAYAVSGEEEDIGWGD